MEENNNEIHCHGCGRLLEEPAHYHDDTPFCASCWKDWCVCADCGEIIREDNAYETNRGIVCAECRRRDYVMCYGCDEYFHIDDTVYCNGEYRCRECHERYQEEAAENRVLEYHDFPTEQYRPRRCDGESAKDDPILLGVELECDDGQFDIETFERWTSDESLIHFEEDGSLSPDGVEAITMPCSLKFHQKEMDWEDFCRKMKRLGFLSHEANQCGLHIHINRDALTPLSIIKMDVFVNRAKEFFGLVGRRFQIYGGRFNVSKRIDVTKGEYNRYTDHNERYTVVNTTNRKTVEIRFPRGSLNPETVIGTIEMIHALARFVEYIPITEIYKTSKNIRKFIDFCADRRYEKVMPMFHRLVKDNRWRGKIEKLYIKQQNRNGGEDADIDGEV